MSMFPYIQDQLFGIFLNGLSGAFLRYVLPALALRAVLAWISARLGLRKRRRQAQLRPQRRSERSAPPPAADLHYL